jgi:hypothetical protein
VLETSVFMDVTFDVNDAIGSETCLWLLPNMDQSNTASLRTLRVSVPALVAQWS